MLIVASTVRDIAIIMVAIESMIIMALMGVLIWQLYRLTRMIQTEVKPMVRDTQDTLSTVRGTTSFLSENMVNPVVRTNARLAGLRRSFQVLAGDQPMPRKARTD